MAALPKPTRPSSTTEKILSQGSTEDSLPKSSPTSPAEVSSPTSPTNSSEATDGHHNSESGHNYNRPSQSSPRNHPRKPPKALCINTGRKSPQYQNGLDPRTGDSGYARKLSVDLEKQELSRPHRTSSSSSPTSEMSDSLCGDGRDRENEILLEQKTLNLLIYLSGICSIVSLFVAAWTLLALVASILLQPLRLFSSRMTFRQQLINYLAPSLTVQLSLIYAHAKMERFNVLLLVLINLLSPLISIGVAIGAWTAAVFWFYAALIGDPSGTDRPEGYNDGKASVLAVRLWWMHWLTRSIR